MVPKPSLIDDWRSAWRFLTVNLAGLGAGAGAAWLMLNDAQQAAVLAFFGLKSAGAPAVAMFLAIMFGRVVKFERPPAAPETAPEDLPTVPDDPRPQQ